MTQFSAGSAAVSIVPDLSGFPTRLRAELGRLNPTVEVDVVPRVDRRDLNRLSAEMTAKSYAVPVRLNTRQARRDLLALGTFSAVAFSALGTRAAVGGLVAVAGAAQQAAGSLALLPAVAVAGSAAVATLAIGAQGLGTAFTAAGKAASGTATDIAAYDAALSDLAPSARTFVEQTRALGPAFGDLRLDVQQRLFAGLGDTITTLGNMQLPTLRTGLAGIADVLNTTARAVAGVFSDPRVVTDFAASLENSRLGLAGFTAGFAPLTRAFTDLATVGSAFLPELGQSFGAASERFADFIAQARESGALRDFFRDSLDALSQIGALLSNVGQIVFTVFRAGSEAGMGFLSALTRLTDEFLVFLRSPVGEEALQAFFASAAAAIGAIIPVIVALLPVILQIGAAFADLATFIAPIVTFLLPLLSGWIGPLIVTVWAAVAAFRTWTAVQALWNLVMLANPIGLVVLAIAGFVAALVWAWQSSETFRNVVTGAFNWVKDVALNVTGAIADSWNWVTGVLHAGWVWVNGNVFQPLGGALGVLGGWFRSAVDTIAGVWATLTDLLMNPVQWVIDFVWNDGLRALWNWVAGLFGGEQIAPFILRRTDFTQGRGTNPGRGGPGGYALSDGGVLPGYSPGRDDLWFHDRTGNVLGLAGGESIMVPQFARVVGGPAGVAALNRAAEAGALGSLRQFAAGGVYREARDRTQPHGRADRGWLDNVSGFFAGLVVPEPLRRFMDYARDETAHTDSRANPTSWASQIGQVIGGAANLLWDGVVGLGAKVLGTDLDGNLILTGLGRQGVFATDSSGWPPGGGGVAANTAQAVSETRAMFPQIRSVGTLGSRPNKSDHPIGKAADFMIPDWATPAGKELGYSVAGFLASRSLAHGLKYLIFDDLYSGGKGWSPYTHPNGATSNATLRHLDHVHASFFARGGILDRYKPSKAEADPWAYEGMFDGGGVLPPGWNSLYNGTGRPEAVLTPAQWDSLAGRSGGASYSVHVGSISESRVAEEALRRFRDMEVLAGL